MNTTPDNESLALWLEDELDGEAASKIDAWAAAHPEHLEERARIRDWKRTLQSAVPAVADLPSAEFFNARILREISTPAVPANVVVMPASKRRVHWMPTAAVAGMALAFFAGSYFTSKPPVSTTAVIQANEPVAYTPEQGVRAATYADAKGTLIVLDGMQAISDTRELMEAKVKPDAAKEFDNTADTQQPNMR